MNQDLPHLENLKLLVVDDHEIILGGTIDVLRQHFPKAKIFVAKTAQTALEKVAHCQPDLVILDLSIPETEGEIARPDTGIQFLKTLMRKYPTLNLTV
ncbi:response regulator [Kovacikia minuta CCNUW1]|uniref:response regulator n=1 Tax=Kovacikia minuta TaxID=2931930 RepID=UPI001CCFAA96|nr:response regulator [Kovacikia minuta]UBF26274.1 response regulator [Kovacikia minuta CCNUW1]